MATSETDDVPQLEGLRDWVSAGVENAKLAVEPGTDETPGCRTITVDDETEWWAFPTLLPCTEPDCPGVGFKRGGPENGWYESYDAANRVVGSRATYTYGTAGSFSYVRNNWARWVPFIEEPGLYEVWVHVAQARTGRDDTSSARYLVASANGVSVHALSQRARYGWISLGSFPLDDTGGAYVELRDVVGDGLYSPTVVYDAVKWVSCGGGTTPPYPGGVYVDTYLTSIPEGATVQPGTRVSFCFDVRPPQTRIRWTYCEPGACQTIASWVDDGRGYCTHSVVSALEGRRTLTIEGIVGGSVVASDSTDFYVASNPEPPPPPPPPHVTTTTPTPTATASPTPEVMKGTILFVHGYGGLFGPQKECADTPHRVELGSEYGYLAEALSSVGFLVFAADWETGPYTAELTEDAQCLSNQINALLEKAEVRNTKTGKITIVGHSMGGLVARRYLESALYRSRGDVVNALITLGTPHEGIRAADIELAHRLSSPLRWGTMSLAKMCNTSPGICNLLDSWVQRYNRLTRTADTVDYYPLGGAVDVPILSAYIPGDDDGVVALESAQGVPPRPARVIAYRVPAAHVDFPFVADTLDIPSYMNEPRTLSAVMEALGQSWGSAAASSGTPWPDPATGDRAKADGDSGDTGDRGPSSGIDRLQGEEELVQLPDLVADLPPNGSTSAMLPLEGVGAALYLRWSGGDVAFDLTAPSGARYDEASLPVQLRGATVERLPLADGGLITIRMDEFEAGNWLLRVTETSGEPCFLLGFGTVRSTIALEVSAPDTVTVALGASTAELPLDVRIRQGSGDVSNAAVVAESGDATATLRAVGRGRYSGSLTVPIEGEWASAVVTADGLAASGSPFRRSESVLVRIATEEVRLSGRPSLVGRDSNGNGLFEDLGSEVSTTCSAEDSYIEGALRPSDGATLSVNSAAAETVGGLCQAVLAFPAADILAAGLAGPYHLDVKVVNARSLDVVLSALEVAVSDPYRLDQFEGYVTPPTRPRPSYDAFLPFTTKGRAAKLDITFGDGEDRGQLTNLGWRFGDVQQLCAREDWYDAAGRTLHVRWYSRRGAAFQPIKPDDTSLNPDIEVVTARGASVQCLRFRDRAGEPISVPGNYYKVEITLDEDLGPFARAVAEVTGGAECGSGSAGARVECIDVSPYRVSVKHPTDHFSAAQPVMVAVAPDGRSVVGWSDTQGSVHVTPLDAGGAREGADLMLDGTDVRGLVAADDWFAVVVRDGFEIRMVRARRDGTVLADTLVLGDEAQHVVGSKWIDSLHDGRLVYDGSRLALYLGHTQRHADGVAHQGALLWLFDLDGRRLEGGWNWGCSHALDVRLAYNGRRIGAACLADPYPHGIAFDTIGITDTVGSLVRAEPQAYPDKEDVSLGGLVPTSDGFLLSFTSPEGRASADVGVIPIGDDAAAGDVRWLTSSAGSDELAPHLVRAGSGFLAAWRVGSAYYLRRLDASGAPSAPARQFDAPFADRDDFVSYPNGEVGWAYAWGDRTVLRLVRVTP